MNRGFTLIELSIVLIIIGLLVGGVLAGRDLIKQAQLSGVVRDISTYKTSLNTFQLKYGDGVRPGDFDNATAYWSGTANGNGDGRVDNDGERLDFWQHLSLADLVDGSYTGVSGASGNEFNEENMPASPITGGYYYGSHNTGTNYGRTAVEQGNYIILGARTTANGKPLTGLLTAQEAQSVDLKGDDGIADQGMTWVMKGAGADGTGLLGDCVANDPSDATAGAYEFTDNAHCRIMFRYQ